MPKPQFRKHQVQVDHIGRKVIDQDWPTKLHQADLSQFKGAVELNPTPGFRVTVLNPHETFRVSRVNKLTALNIQKRLREEASTWPERVTIDTEEIRYKQGYLLGSLATDETLNWERQVTLGILQDATGNSFDYSQFAVAVELGKLTNLIHRRAAIETLSHNGWPEQVVLGRNVIGLTAYTGVSGEFTI